MRFRPATLGTVKLGVAELTGSQPALEYKFGDSGCPASLPSWSYKILNPSGSQAIQLLDIGELRWAFRLPTCTSFATS
jgi:hypothetical protein